MDAETLELLGGVQNNLAQLTATVAALQTKQEEQDKKLDTIMNGMQAMLAAQEELLR